MMDKYKDRIPLFGQGGQTTRSYSWGYRGRARRYQQKRRRESPTSSDSERDYYERSKKKERKISSFRARNFYGYSDRRGTVTCYNCGGIGHIISNRPSANPRTPNKPKSQD